VVCTSLPLKQLIVYEIILGLFALPINVHLGKKGISIFLLEQFSNISGKIPHKKQALSHR
jgi:hypothetical protein